MCDPPGNPNHQIAHQIEQPPAGVKGDSPAEHSYPAFDVWSGNHWIVSMNNADAPGMGKPQWYFVFGLLTGIAVAALIGVLLKALAG